MKNNKSYKYIFTFFVIGFLLVLWVEPSFSDKIDRAYDSLDEGIALERKGHLQDALKLFKRAWETAGIPEACYKIAKIYDAKLNDDRQAVKYYTEFLEVEEDTPLALKAQDFLDKARHDIIATEKWKNELLAKKLSLSEYTDPIRQELGPSKEKKAEELTRFKQTENEYPSQPTVCLTCHGGYMGPGINMEATHPVGRIPTGVLDETVPQEVRFYKEGRVICMSCHDPQNIHFSQGAEGKTYKTLRVATDDGEDMPRFCALCHSEKVSPRVIRSQRRREREKDEEYDRDAEFEWEGGRGDQDSMEEDIMDYERR